MGSNLPPGAATDPNAPWNQPDPEDYFPMWCEECGFKADSPEQMTDHEHPDDYFVRNDPQRGQVEQKCAVCNPPVNLRGMMKTGQSLPYCDSHDEDDFQEKLRYEEKQMEEEHEQRRTT